MKIGIIGTRGIPNAYGGFEQFAQYLSAALEQKGHEVYVYSPSWHPYKESNWHSVKIIHINDPAKLFGTKSQFIYDRSCLRDARKHHFNILLHLGYTSDSIWHRSWPRNTKHLVNMDGLEWQRAKYGVITRRFLKWAESLAVRYADLLIADSPAIQDYINSEYKKPSKYIPYGATVFNDPEPTKLELINVLPYTYGLVIARMEPENNIEMIIRGFLDSSAVHTLLVVGNTNNKYGHYLTRTYKSERIRFLQGIYDLDLLNNLRYHSTVYFHGHSSGGTNPSLLEAMASHCQFIAHYNVFNRAVLRENAQYFLSPSDVARSLDNPPDQVTKEINRSLNLERIRSDYDWPSIIDRYESAMLECLGARA